MARDYGKGKYSGKNEPEYVEKMKGLADVERLRLEYEEKILDVHQQINNELEKQWFTDEKLSKAEKNRVQDLQHEMNIRVTAMNTLDKEGNKKKKQLRYGNDELKVMQKILKNRKNTNSLVDDYLQLQHDISTTGSKQLSADKKAHFIKMSGLIEEEVIWRRTQKVKDEASKKLLDTFESIGPSVKSISTLIQNMVNNPLSAMMTMIKFTAGGFKDFSNQMDGVGKQFGVFGFRSEEVQQSLGQILRDGASLDISMKDLSQVLPSISAQFGLSQVESLKLAENVVRTGITLGISNTESNQLYNVLTAMHEVSSDQLDTTLKQQAAWAETQGVVPSVVISQMAKNTNFIALNTKDMGEEMLNTAISATKLGIELSTVEKIQGKLLNFQQSIRDEFELSVLLGRRVNLTQARGLMLQGKTDDALRSVVDQMRGVDLKNLDVLTLQKISDATGVAATDIQKMVSRGGELNNTLKATGNDLGNMDLNDINAEAAVSAVTKLENTTKNAARIANEQLVDGFGKAETAIKGVTSALTSTLLTLGGIGLATITFVGSLAMAVRYATQLNTQLQLAGRMPGSVIPQVNTPKNSGQEFGDVYQTKTGRYKRKGMSGKGFETEGLMEAALEKKKLSTKSSKGGGMMGKFGKGMKGFGKVAGPMMIGMAALETIGNISEQGAGKGLLKSLDENKGMAMGAAIGSLFFGAGAIPGAAIGGLFDMVMPTIGSYHSGTGNVPRSGKYNLLQGEAVIPRSRNMTSAMGGISSMNTSAVQGGGNMKLELSDDTLSKMMFGQVKANQMYGLPNQTSQRIKESTQMTNQIWAVGAA